MTTIERIQLPPSVHGKDLNDRQNDQKLLTDIERAKKKLEPVNRKEPRKIQSNFNNLEEGEQPLAPEIIDHTEDGIALLFAEKNPCFRWVQPWGRWYIWNGQVWLKDEKLAVYTKIRELVRAVASDGDSKVLKRASTINAIEKLARCDTKLAACPEQWDQDLFLINTQGGHVDLSTGQLFDHDPNKYMTRMVNCSPQKGCPRWLQFLDEITDGDKELQGFLQRVIGYCLSGSVREHALFFLYGTGRNGKGVFLNTLVAMLADYATVAPIEALMETKNDRHSTELATLMGKRLVIAQEVDEGVKWAEAKIKALTGGDPITARYMRQDFFTFEPQFKLVIAGNHKPAFRSIDEALRARLHLIPFTVTIPKEKRDPDLQAVLKSEWGGILQWAIEGAAEYNRIGLKPPKAVTQATDAYFEDQDIFNQWISDCCDVSPDYWEPPALLFTSWKDYAKDSNIAAGTTKTFKDQMEKAGYPAGNSRAMGGRHYLGIRKKMEAANDHY